MTEPNGELNCSEKCLFVLNLIGIAVVIGVLLFLALWSPR
jgi:hypothetical protein